MPRTFPLRQVWALEHAGVVEGGSLWNKIRVAPDCAQRTLTTSGWGAGVGGRLRQLVKGTGRGIYTPMRFTCRVEPAFHDLNLLKAGCKLPADENKVVDDH